MRRIDPADVALVVGIVMLSVGLYFWYPPAVLIVDGALLVFFAVLGSR